MSICEVYKSLSDKFLSFYIISKKIIDIKLKLGYD